MDSLENLRVLAGSKDFFRGLQHPDSPVQIRSAPLERSRKTNVFRDSLYQENHAIVAWFRESFSGVFRNKNS